MKLFYDEKANQIVVDLEGNVIHSFNQSMMDANDKPLQDKLEELGIKIKVRNGRFVAADKAKNQSAFQMDFREVDKIEGNIEVTQTIDLL